MRSVSLILALALFPLAAQHSTPSRAEVEAMEQAFDKKIRQYSLDSPMEVLGLTRGLYLQGYGVVFTTELSVVQSPMLSPFRPPFTKEEIAKLKQTKLRRMPELKTLMRQMMVSSAGSIDRLPMEERVVLGVFLFYNNWEDSTGMPRRITMAAQRRALLDIAANHKPDSAMDQVIQVREED